MPQDAEQFLSDPPVQADAGQFLSEGAPAGYEAAQKPPVQQMAGPWRLPAMVASTIVGAGARLLGLPGDLDKLGNKYLPTWATRDWISGETDPEKLGTVMPSSEEFFSVTDPLGITRRPDLVPQNKLEKYGSAAVSGAATGLTIALSGGGAALPLTVSGTAGNLAGEAAHELMPESKAAPIVAGFLTGLGTNSVMNWMSRTSSAKSALARLDEAQAKLDQAQEARHYGGRAAELKADDIIKNSQKVLEVKTQVADSAVEAAKKSTADLFEHVAASRGESRTLQEAGEALQSHARTWIEDVLPTRIKQAWEPVDAAIPPEMPLPLEHFTNSLKEINASAGELETVAGLLKPGLPSKLDEALTSSKLLKSVEGDGLPSGMTYTWTDVARLRSTLGDALADPAVIKGVGAKNLDRLYASLTADMSAGAERAGALDSFNLANQESRRLYNIAEGPISRVVAGARRSSDDPLPESVAARLLSGGKKGASDLQILRAEIPGGVNELAAAHLRVPGQPWGKLSPEARQALVPVQELSASLDSGLAARLAAEESASRSVLSAKRDHSEISISARESRRTEDFSHSDRVFKAQNALAKAKTEQPPPPDPVKNLFHRGQQALGATLGYQAAPAILSELGINPSPMSIGAMTATGLALPYLGRSLKDALRNPASVAVATVAGGNPLSLEPRK